MVMSSLIEPFLDQLAIRGERRCSIPFHFLQQAFGEILKEDVNDFPSTSDTLCASLCGLCNRKFQFLVTLPCPMNK
jgi:hypothetical protein